MKLYSVKVEAEYVVLAMDEEGAKRAAAEALEEDGDYNANFYPVDLEYLPFGWDGDELPWIDPYLEDPPERDVNEWIKRGAAPVLTARMAKKVSATPKATRHKGTPK